MTGQAGLLSEIWDKHAPEWIAWVRAPNKMDSYWRFHGEKFLSLVPDPRGLTVDIGCGEGRVGRDLQHLGHKVLGIDCSFIMCQAAADHPAPAPVVVADAVRLPLADDSADCAIAFMSLQDIDDMPAAVREIARILKDDQHLVLAIVHPVYSGGGFWRDSTDAGTDNRFVIERSYFQDEYLTRDDKQGDLTITFHRRHRPIEAYTGALTDAGFIIEQLREVTDPDTSDPRHRIPMFLDILATRRPRKSPDKTRQMPEIEHSSSSDSLLQSPVGLNGTDVRLPVQPEPAAAMPEAAVLASASEPSPKLSPAVRPVGGA